MFAVGGIRYEGFSDPQVVLSLLDRQRVPDRARRRHDLRDPHRRHRPVGRLGGGAVHDDRREDPARWAGRRTSSMAAVLLTGTLLGLLMGLLIHYFDIQPFIATLAGMFLARGPDLPDQRRVDLDQRPDLHQPGVQARSPVGDYYLRWTAIIALVVVAIAAYVLARTRFGRTVYAIGGSESSAMLMGLRVAFTKVGVYVISGFCASLGGLLFSFYILSGNSLHAVGMELDAIAAVVIGGTLLTGGRGLRRRLAARRPGARHDPDPDLLRRHPELVLDPDHHRRCCCSPSSSSSASSPGGSRDRRRPATAGRPDAGDGRRRPARRRLAPDRLPGGQRPAPTSARRPASGC